MRSSRAWHVHRYYDEDEGPDVSCALCPSGSDCVLAGTTLAAIPIYRGYYRRSPNTIDIRRCPDAGTNCGNKYVCPQTTSGCRGTVVARNETSRRLQSDNAPSELGCADGLTGLYCMLCDRKAFREPVYYAPATESDIAKCKLCGDTLSTTIAVAAGIIAAVGLAAALVYGLYRHMLSPKRKDALNSLLEKFSLGTKLKILIVFCARQARAKPRQRSAADASLLTLHHPCAPPADQIATKISTVYSVELPPATRQVLESIRIVVSIGVAAVSTPLECLRLEGYRNLLLFWMVLPAAFVAAIALVALGILLWQPEPRTQFSRTPVCILCTQCTTDIAALGVPQVASASLVGPHHAHRARAAQHVAVPLPRVPARDQHRL